MANPVEATATTAAQLFSVHRFHVPDFQREYAWRVDGEVSDFWRDILSSVDEGAPHFLGLVILTEEEGWMTLVDGQQRVVTTFLLAKALYDAALDLGRRLVASSLTDTFLYELDFRTESRMARVQLSTPRDIEVLDAILSSTDRPDLSSSRLMQAWKFLNLRLREDLAKSDGPLRLGQWAQHLNAGLQFAIFEHPDRNAAFKVYEVINTRGKQLTPAELLKSYFIGTSDEGSRGAVVDEWRQAEDALQSVELTRFIRHAATLRHGYIIQRDLYQLLTRRYKTAASVEELMQYLSSLLPWYQQLVDPTGDFAPDDAYARASNVLNYLGLTTVRPLLLALSAAQNSEEGYATALRIIVPRATVESFGTGAVEARFANAAAEISRRGEWESTLAELRDLRPGAQDFHAAISGGRPLSRTHMHVIRAAALQGSPLPYLEGGLHLIRTRYGQGWPLFDDDDFREFGNRLGNTVLLETERRPHGSSSAQGALARLVPALAEEEIVTDEDIDYWSPSEVLEMERRIAEAAVAAWYTGRQR